MGRMDGTPASAAADSPACTPWAAATSSDTSRMPGVDTAGAGAGRGAHSPTCMRFHALRHDEQQNRERLLWAVYSRPHIRHRAT